MTTTLKKEDLYRMPWSLTDNPIGWLEVTDICNLYCKGCYRQRIEGHKSIEQVKEEIDFLQAVRNCDDITIAGGEPLVYPHIMETIRHIKSKGMKAIMLTNGKAMTEEKMRELKAAGLTGMTFHIDQMQDRKKWEDKNELDLMELRQSFVTMLRTIGGGMHLSFGCTTYNENFQYLPKIVEWARLNSDVVAGLVFITFRAIPVDGEVDYKVGGEKVNPEDVIYSSADVDEINITSYDVWNKCRDHFGEWRSAAYLDGTHHHESIKWLITSNIVHNGKSLGFMGAKGMEKVQTDYHWKTGRYFAYKKSHNVPKPLLALGCFVDDGLRQAFFRLLPKLINPLNWFKPVKVLSIGVVQAPDLLPNGDCDMCDSCPDMTVYKGRLYRSCRLDEVRKFGDFMTLSQGVTEEEEEASVGANVTAGKPATTTASSPAKPTVPQA